MTVLKNAHFNAVGNSMIPAMCMNMDTMCMCICCAYCMQSVLPPKDKLSHR